MRGEGGSSFDGGKAGAFRNGGRGSGVGVGVCVLAGIELWIFNLTSQLSYSTVRHFTSVVCGGDGSSNQLTLWTGRVQQFFGSTPSRSTYKHNQNS